MIRNRRLISELVLLMLAALLFNGIGYPFLASMVRLQNRRHIPDADAGEDVVPMRFQQSGAQPEWVEHGEFRYKGRMYDVMHVEQKEGYTTYYVQRDRREEGLFAHLARLFGSSSSNATQNGIQGSLPMLLAKYYMGRNRIGLPALKPGLFLMHAPGVKPIDHFLSIPNPPPRSLPA